MPQLPSGANKKNRETIWLLILILVVSISWLISMFVNYRVTKRQNRINQTLHALSSSNGYWFSIQFDSCINKQNSFRQKRTMTTTTAVITTTSCGKRRVASNYHKDQETGSNRAERGYKTIFPARISFHKMQLMLDFESPVGDGVAVADGLSMRQSVNVSISQAVSQLVSH